MKLYADAPARRTRQVLADLLFVAWLVLWAWVGTAVHDGTTALAGPARQTDSSATSMAEQLRDAGGRLGEAPLVGLSVALIPILVAAAIHLPIRWRFVREATAGVRFIDAQEDLDLFALRALANQPVRVLAEVGLRPGKLPGSAA